MDDWHVPTDDEWKILESSVDSFHGVEDPVWDNWNARGYDAGGNLKETGFLHWAPDNVCATNSSGFSALAGGQRSYYQGGSLNLFHYGYFWTSTNTISRTLAYASVCGVYRYVDSSYSGFSLRCIKD